MRSLSLFTLEAEHHLAIATLAVLLFCFLWDHSFSPGLMPNNRSLRESTAA